MTRSYEVALPLTIVGMIEGGLGIGVLTTAAQTFRDMLLKRPSELLAE